MFGGEFPGDVPGEFPSEEADPLPDLLERVNRTGWAPGLALLLSALCSQGCGAKQQEPEAGCGAPDATVYLCSAQAPEAGGCLGAAVSSLFVDEDAEIAYPAGCRAILPICSAATIPSQPLTCFCAMDGDAGPLLWNCPD